MTDRSRFHLQYKMIPMLIVMGIIFFLSHQPGDSFDLPEILNFDKVLHALAYGVLAGSVLLALASGKKKKQVNTICLLAILICLAYGVSDETHQVFIPGRQASGWDIAADFAGSLMVVASWRYWVSRAKLIPGKK